jgi:tetratricopeptide (TPR) repeat protein
MRAQYAALLVAWGVVSAVSAPAADAPKAQKLSLDSRSVLVSWTNEVKAPAPAETVVATNAAAESNTVKSAGQDEISQLLDKAYKRIDYGGVQDAVGMFNDVLKRDPANKRARFGLGTAYIQMQRYKEALAVLEPMAKEFPEDYFLKNNIAWLYATAKDVSIRSGAKAVQYAQDALLIAPGDYHVWSTLSEGYYVSGHYDKALRAAEEALKLSLDSPTGAEGAEEYRRQVEKNRKAAQAMSVLE